MAQQANLQAATRTETGKGAARSLRREGKVPGVIYGHNRQAEAVAIDTAALNKMLIGISAGTTVLDVVVDGRPAVKALIREIQRDSVRPAEILHLDLYEVRADEKVTLSVPIHLIGIPDGVRNSGGVLDHSLRELEIEVLPADIPEHVELDVTALTIGHRCSCETSRSRKPRSSTSPTRRSAAWWRRGRRRLRPRLKRSLLRQSRSSSGSPSRTKRPKQNRKPRTCIRSLGWVIQARSTKTPGTMPGSAWQITWHPAGGWVSSVAASELGKRRAPGIAFR